MAKENGWWNLEVSTEISDADWEHIAKMIRKGFTGGEICEDEPEEDED